VTREDPGSDEAWLAALRSGNAEAFEALYARYFRRVYQFAARRVASRTDAEDVTHETFLELLRSRARFDGRSGLDSWVFGVARNVLREHLRADRRRDARELVAGLPSEPATPEAELAAQRLALAVSRELGAADAWQREVFRLHYLEHVPVREIARRTARSRHALGASLDHLRTRVLRGAGVSKR
jgi:RNA polymerase sigma-70 factor (ECF subfamily)